MKEFWGNTPQHTIDFAERIFAENRERMQRGEEYSNISDEQLEENSKVRDESK